VSRNKLNLLRVGQIGGWISGCVDTVLETAPTSAAPQQTISFSALFSQFGAANQCKFTQIDRLLQSPQIKLD
jgi:hypothetical protein